MASITSWVSSSELPFVDNGKPVVVFLHGYGSNERDLPGVAQWLGLENHWVSLQAPVALGNGGFAWFPITTPLNPSASDVSEPTDAVWNWVETHLGAVPIIVIGFSQGALISSQLLRTRPDRIVKTVFLAGFTAATEQIGDAQLRASRPEVFWARGTADGVVSPDAVDRAAKFFADHVTLDAHVYPGLGHSIDERVLTDVRDYLAR